MSRAPTYHMMEQFDYIVEYPILAYIGSWPMRNYLVLADLSKNTP